MSSVTPSESGSISFPSRRQSGFRSGQREHPADDPRDHGQRRDGRQRPGPSGSRPTRRRPGVAGPSRRRAGARAREPTQTDRREQAARRVRPPGPHGLGPGPARRTMSIMPHRSIGHGLPVSLRIAQGDSPSCSCVPNPARVRARAARPSRSGNDQDGRQERSGRRERSRLAWGKPPLPDGRPRPPAVVDLGGAILTLEEVHGDVSPRTIPPEDDPKTCKASDRRRGRGIIIAQIGRSSPLPSWEGVG